MSENLMKKYYVSLFFSSLKMMALREYDIGPYSELLREYDENNAKEENGMEANFISYEELETIVCDINLYEYGVPEPSNPKELKISYFVSNRISEKITYVCFYNSGEMDILTDDIVVITKRCNQIWESNNENSNDGGFFGPNSNYSFLILVKNKIGSYPKERISRIKQTETMEERMVFVEPFNNPLQSEIRKMSNQKYAKLFSGIPKSNMPSIGASDPYMRYLSIKKDSHTEIFRDSINESDPQGKYIHYKNITKN